MMHPKWVCHALTQGIRLEQLKFLSGTKSAAVDKFITEKQFNVEFTVIKQKL